MERRGIKMVELKLRENFFTGVSIGYVGATSGVLIITLFVVGISVIQKSIMAGSVILIFALFSIIPPLYLLLRGFER